MKELLEKLAELIGLCDRKNRELDALNSNAKKLTEELEQQKNTLGDRERDLDSREARVVTGELALRQAEETKTRLASIRAEQTQLAAERNAFVAYREKEAADLRALRSRLESDINSYRERQKEIADKFLQLEKEKASFRDEIISKIKSELK
jgi:DNA repair exonuclease SbcCD ATPase subunit